MYKAQSSKRCFLCVKSKHFCDFVVIFIQKKLVSPDCSFLYPHLKGMFR